MSVLYFLKKPNDQLRKFVLNFLWCPFGVLVASTLPASYMLPYLKLGFKTKRETLTDCKFDPLCVELFPIFACVDRGYEPSPKKT